MTVCDKTETQLIFSNWASKKQTMDKMIIIQAKLKLYTKTNHKNSIMQNL